MLFLSIMFSPLSLPLPLPTAAQSLSQRSEGQKDARDSQCEQASSLGKNCSFCVVWLLFCL